MEVGDAGVELHQLDVEGGPDEASSMLHDLTRAQGAADTTIHAKLDAAMALLFKDDDRLNADDLELAEDAAIMVDLGVVDLDANMPAAAEKWQSLLRLSIDTLTDTARAFEEKALGHNSNELAMMEVREHEFEHVGKPVFVYWKDIKNKIGLRVRLDERHKPIFSVTTWGPITKTKVAPEKFDRVIHPAVGIHMVKEPKHSDARPTLRNEMVHLRKMWDAAANTRAGKASLDPCEVCNLPGENSETGAGAYACALCTLPFHEACSRRFLAWAQDDWAHRGLRPGGVAAWPWADLSTITCPMCQYAALGPG